MGIGKRIKEARERLGLTQSELGELIGVTGSAITNYEKETSHPKEPIMYKLFDALHVDANYLFQDVVNIPSKINDVTLAEYDHIKKYRIISEKDEDGKALVDSTVDYVYNRIKLVQEKDLQLSTLQEQLHIQKLHNRMCLYSYLGKIACAGAGFYFDDIPTDTIEVPYMEGADFIIGVSGESMEPTYHDGDKLYVQKINALTLGDEGIFTVRGECFVKELGERGLISRNPNYDDIEGTEDIRLIGRVLGKVDDLLK